MLSNVSWWTLASILIFQQTFLCYAAQVPLTRESLDIPSVTLDHDDSYSRVARTFEDWLLDLPPNVNSTSQLVFETVNSFLQHWPNTRMRHGHSIVPGTIPQGTLLYHGRRNQELPPGPEWTATDPEHSLIFCMRVMPGKECWHLTLITTRPLNVVYFDGSSAAKVGFGSMDAQDMVAWDEPRPGWEFQDAKRITDLCTWGEKYGVDGFVRMEMDFEIMLCNFTSGIKTVSFLHLAEPISQKLSRPWSSFEVINAGSWHNHYPGETRIHLDLTRLVSFYDTYLVPSLVPVRFGQERWDHRVANTSAEDVARVKARLEEVLTRPSNYPTSGIDWSSLIHVIVDRYAQRLELVRYLLNFTDSVDPTDLVDHANKTQTQLRIMLTPYILSSILPPSSSDSDTNGDIIDALDWAKPVFKHCATTHTDMSFDDNVMTDSEELLFSAIQETTREICRVTTKMWAIGVVAGIDRILNTSVSDLRIEKIRDLTKEWRRELDWLMQWLDWSEWVKCRPACGAEEMCYLTTWPVGFPRPWSPKVAGASSLPTLPLMHSQPDAFPAYPIADDWERPQPRCIRVMEPYLGL